MIIIIPARGGSKRLKHKNIQPLRGKPLLSYTLENIQAAALNIPTYVSTDDEGIAEVARRYPGVQVVIRPAELASDTASTESVLLHILDQLNQKNEYPDWLMTLPPTAPFRSANTIKIFAERTKYLPDDIDCLMSVTENRGDFWHMSPDEKLKRLFPDAPRRQQERTPLFEENSAVYVSRTTSLKTTGSILGLSTCGIAIPRIEGFDINSVEDLAIAERLHDLVFNKTTGSN